MFRAGSHGSTQTLGKLGIARQSTRGVPHLTGSRSSTPIEYDRAESRP